MQSDAQVTFFIAFITGVLSFVTPCVLPLIPSYVTFITGISLREFAGKGKRSHARRLTILHSLFFILGFSLVFIILGASATFLGQLAGHYQTLIRKVGAVVIVIFGFYIALPFYYDYLQRRKTSQPDRKSHSLLEFLLKERKIHLEKKPMGLLGTLLVGVTFGIGWTPCTGPILATILIYAGTAEKVSTGIYLLIAYSLGMGLPFFLSSLAINSFLVYYRKLQRFIPLVSLASGFFLVLVGVLLYFDFLSLVIGYFNSWLAQLLGGK